MMQEKSNILEVYPKSNISQAGNNNPAVQLYGRRYYKDQTAVEYLAEFLLVFISPKTLEPDAKNSYGEYSFVINLDDAKYFPKAKVPLKLFAFLSTSKLETRHPAHIKAYHEALSLLEKKFEGESGKVHEAIKLLQSLLNGFVGVANNRTWVTHTFLPVSASLLAREVDWLHKGKSGAKNADLEWFTDTDSKSTIEKYFSYDRHNFMARGGEVLFLQLSNLFEDVYHADIRNFMSLDSYKHIKEDLKNLKINIERNLKILLVTGTEVINRLVDFVETNLKGFELTQKSAQLGVVPQVSRIEALLFAYEINNICKANLGNLEKLELLQILCCLHVLRSHCFQAARLVNNTELPLEGFVGHYTWIVSSETSTGNYAMRNMSQQSFKTIDNLLYRALHDSSLVKPDDYTEAQEHGYNIFKKIGKEIGLLVPRTGASPRFVLHQGLIRFLVAALIPPGERILLTQFYQRLFAHYGIAINGEQLTIALQWLGQGEQGQTYSVDHKSAWLEEALKQGGFLVELSDAVSMVKNPGDEA